MVKAPEFGSQNQDWPTILTAVQSQQELVTLPFVHFGTNAELFLGYAKDPQHVVSLTPPLTATKAKWLLEQFTLLDADFLQDPHWRTYEKDFKILQNKILAAYRLTVINALALPVSPMMAIQSKTFLGIVNQYVYLNGDTFSTPLMQHYETELNQTCQDKLTAIPEQLKQSDLPTTIHWLNQTLQDIRYSLAYEIIEPGKAELILSPLKEKLILYEDKMQRIEQVLENICRQALPGVFIQDFVTKEVERLREQGFFKRAKEIGPVLLVKLLNSPDMLRSIHEKVIHAQVESCLGHLYDSTLLRQEIRKMTVYRIRRNVISGINHHILQKYHFLPTPFSLVSREDEDCLMTLQEEYLHAIYRQIDQMPRHEITDFLQALKNDPVLKPLPKTSYFGHVNNFAQHEFDLLLKHYALPEKNPLQEGVSLHDIDCSVEMDILGEMSQQLIEISSAELKEMKDANIVMQEFQNMYKSIQAANFIVNPTWEDFYDRQQYALLKTFIDNQSNMSLRLDMLEAIHDRLIGDKQKKIFWLKARTDPAVKQRSALTAWVQENIMKALNTIVATSESQMMWDKYALYQSRIEPHLRGREDSPQVASLLKLLMEKPLAPH